MINKLQIENYQSHKKTVLDFHPGVNVIVGTSDSGKSAILRALRWICTGVPRGDGFRSHWGGDTEVTLETNTDVIFRGKTNSDNVYVLNETEFRAFGTDVPEEIVTALNLDEAVNIQKQLDQPYLISETPGNVAQHFNRMAHLEKIDVGLKNVQSQIRETEQSLKSKGTELKAVETDEKTYTYLTEAEEKLAAIEIRQDKLTALKIENAAVQGLIEDIVAVDGEIVKAEKPLQAEAAVNSLLGKYMQVDAEKTLKNALKSLVEDIDTVAVRIEKAKKYIAAEKAVDLLIEKRAELKELKNNLTKIKTVVEDIEEVDDLEQVQSNQLTVWQKSYEENMPEVCPLCGDENCKH